jgi:RNA polymerase sigma-70 factor (ECF subfamily)
VTVDEARQRWRERRDDEAFARLVEDAYDALLAFVRHRTRNCDRAPDIVQDTMAIAWEKRADFDPDWCEFLTWLCGIAKRQCGHELRERILAGEWERTWTICSPGLSPGPQELVAARARREAVWQILAGLDIVDRIVLVMHKMEGLTCMRISKELDMPYGTVKMHFVRGRHRFIELAGTIKIPAADLDAVEAEWTI